MRYIAIRMKNRDAYVQHLENLSNEGGRVISAGMAENSTCSCYEWWAIVEKQRKAQQTPEAPNSETAELLEAARKLKGYCERTKCIDCPFGYDNGLRCELCESAPEYWKPERRLGNV